MKKINWSVILNIVLAISTIGSFIFGIFAFYYNKSPSLSLYKTSEINVLEINRSLDDLKILYKDNDIQNEKKNIKIVNLKIKNDSKVDITQNMFDENLPWGIMVKDGDIVQARVIDSSNEYLLKSVNPLVINDIVKFNKIIIESGESFSIELVILCENKVYPKYEFIGKIAGVNNANIKVIENNNEQVKSFWTDLIYGSIGIHVARFFLYFLCTIIVGLFIALIWVIISKIKEAFIHHERKVRIKLVVLEKEKGLHFDDIQNFYINNGYNKLKEILDLLNNPSRLESIYQKKISHVRKDNNKEFDISNFFYYSSFSLIDNMLNLKIITVNEDKLSIDSNFKNEIKVFLKSVKQ